LIAGINGATPSASTPGVTLTDTLGVLSTVAQGTATQVLTCNGGTAAPTWQDVGAATFQVKNQVFTSSGTYTPTTGMAYCSIQCLGGGGSGGGAGVTNAGQLAGGSGGGAGEYAVGIFSSATIGISKIITIGAAGTDLSGSGGGNGGNTSVGSLITAFGGTGGPSNGASSTPQGTAGGAGGTGGSGGDYRSPGFPGQGFFSSVGAGLCVAGDGGSSQIGSGGQAGKNQGASTAGGAALGYGAGGGGAFNIASSGSTLAGGSGTAGIVIVTEYIT
jgi:hypothetical protein